MGKRSNEKRETEGGGEGEVERGGGAGGRLALEREGRGGVREGG